MKNALLAFIFSVFSCTQFPGCDSLAIDEAVLWKKKYDQLMITYEELVKKYVTAQKELEQLKSNSKRFMENTKSMLEDD